MYASRLRSSRRHGRTSAFNSHSLKRKRVHRSRTHIFMRRQGKLSTKVRQTTDRTAVPVDHIDFPVKHQFAASGPRVWSESMQFFPRYKVGGGREIDRTYHLESGEVFFPPNEFLVLRAHGGHHVVEVHDDVDEGVEQTEEGRVTAGRETNSEPDAHWHDAVVDDVQQRNVLIFLAQHEENLENERRHIHIIRTKIREV
jgi:hypothetical protein